MYISVDSFKPSIVFFHLSGFFAFFEQLGQHGFFVSIPTLPLLILTGTEIHTCDIIFPFPLERICPKGISGIIACELEDKIWPSDLSLFTSGLAAERCTENCSVYQANIVIARLQKRAHSNSTQQSSLSFAYLDSPAAEFKL